MDPDWIVTQSRARAKARYNTSTGYSGFPAYMVPSHRKSVMRWVRLLHLIPPHYRYTARPPRNALATPTPADHMRLSRPSHGMARALHPGVGQKSLIRDKSGMVGGVCAVRRKVLEAEVQNMAFQGG